MRSLLIGLTLAVGPLAISHAAAQDARPAPAGDNMARPMRGGGGLAALQSADANNDGIVTRAEAIAAADARFAALDTNHDGQVTGDEMMAAMPPRRAARMDGGDARPAMTKAEFEARSLRRFDRLDADGNGRIDATEFANAREAMRERRQERSGQSGQGAPAAPDR